LAAATESDAPTVPIGTSLSDLNPERATLPDDEFTAE